MQVPTPSPGPVHRPGAIESIFSHSAKGYTILLRVTQFSQLNLFALTWLGKKFKKPTTYTGCVG